MLITMQALHNFLLLHVLACLGQNGYGSEIVHGELVPEGLMLYMVSVQTTSRHVCGGFLVTEEFVITAAHCDVHKPRYVVLGSHNLTDRNKLIYRHIERRYKPSEYRNVGTGNDIMLLKLSRKVPVDNRVETIQLPSSETQLAENQMCRIAGWGKTSTQGHGTDNLKMVDVPVISPQVCKERWPGLPASVICAGGYGTDKGFCQGDSGGPLVCNGKAVGIVSFNKNENCIYPDEPNVFTDISKFLPWINSIIESTKR